MVSVRAVLLAVVVTCALCKDCDIGVQSSASGTSGNCSSSSGADCNFQSAILRCAACAVDGICTVTLPASNTLTTDALSTLVLGGPTNPRVLRIFGSTSTKFTGGLDNQGWLHVRMTDSDALLEVRGVSFSSYTKTTGHGGVLHVNGTNPDPAPVVSCFSSWCPPVSRYGVAGSVLISSTTFERRDSNSHYYHF